jgi:glycosyltransferase involved in cell wall biosynthesis
MIPTYNRPCLLNDCLKSVVSAARPKYLNATMVVVDNCSGDETEEVVQSLAGRGDLPFRYLFVGRSGKSLTLNDALAQAAVFVLQGISTPANCLGTIGLLFRTYVRSEITPRIRSFFFAEASI